MADHVVCLSSSCCLKAALRNATFLACSRASYAYVLEDQLAIPTDFQRLVVILLPDDQGVSEKEGATSREAHHPALHSRGHC